MLKDLIINFILNSLNKHQRRFKRKLLNGNVDISLGQNVHIAYTADLEILDGGKILIGENTSICHGVLLSTHGGIIEIGKNCSINPYTIIYGHSKTKIGNNVLIAGHCMIIPANHVFENKDELIIKQGLNKIGIIIEDDVWIGHGCSILDGVCIGKGSIVAAGSVVNKDIPPNSIYAGVPAKLIGIRK